MADETRLPGEFVFADQTLAPGTVLADRYRIDRRIGAGGMGTVYAAWHLPLRRPVALKVLSRAHATDPTYVRRFRRADP